MFIKHLSDCPEFKAGDMTLIKEVANPTNDPWPIGYSLAHARLPIGEASIPHQLKGTELYYILEGEGLMHIDNEVKKVVKDNVLLVPNGAEQFIENIGAEELVFLVVVEPFWRVEDEIVG